MQKLQASNAKDKRAIEVRFCSFSSGSSVSIDWAFLHFRFYVSFAQSIGFSPIFCSVHNNLLLNASCFLLHSQESTASLKAFEDSFDKIYKATGGVNAEMDVDMLVKVSARMFAFHFGLSCVRRVLSVAYGFLPV